MQVISHCPVCSGRTLTQYLSPKDYTVSHETFHLKKCDTCSFVLTSPQPDQSDLSRYYQSDNYISHSTKARSFFDRIYRLARNYNITSKIDLVKSHLPTQGQNNLLDFGCGTGEFLLKAKREGFQIAGVEPSDNARKFAQALTETKITQTLPDEQKKFDAVTLWHVLEHVPDLNKKFESIVAALTQNGTIFIAVPNHQSLDSKHYREKWAGYDVPRHLWHFTTESMTRFLSNHSLKLHKVVPMKLDALYVSILSEQYLAGRRNPQTMFKGIMKGLQSNWSAARTREYSSHIYVAGK